MSTKAGKPHAEAQEPLLRHRVPAAADARWAAAGPRLGGPAWRRWTSRAARSSGRGTTTCSGVYKQHAMAVMGLAYVPIALVLACAGEILFFLGQESRTQASPWRPARRRGGSSRRSSSTCPCSAACASCSVVLLVYKGQRSFSIPFHCRSKVKQSQ